MIAHNVVVSVGLLLMVFAVSAQDTSHLNRLPKETPAAAQGKQTYREYCAACHGSDGRGMGPAASALKTPPADLSTLAKRNGGKFPYDYVSDVVRFGKPVVAHGSNDMPVWGPIFAVRDNFNEAAVRQRIKNLCEYLATLQEKES